MFDIHELYQEVIMDHNRRPRNFQVLEGADMKAEGYNPLCGDQITLYMNVREGIIEDVGIQVSGCAISKASASMMTEGIKGKTVKEAEIIFEKFRELVKGEELDDEDLDLLGDLEILSGVSRYPVRIKCAVLSWHTFKSALSGNTDGVATTE
ncbi:MAG: SUF system NifU family Fe-S cluster assembly protein [Chloroflexi bacterium]|nr:SUF system NifU family Fe-S cluster assembly protein [Chloroflexota bacterium]